MKPIPKRLRDQMERDPAMKRCIYSNSDCRDEYGNRMPRAEWEHCFIWAGRQINEWWAIIGCCWYHHRGPGLNKDFNRWKALERMNEKDILEADKKYPGVGWGKTRDRLRKKFYGKQGELLQTADQKMAGE